MMGKRKNAVKIPIVALFMLLMLSLAVPVQASTATKKLKITYYSNYRGAESKTVATRDYPVNKSCTLINASRPGYVFMGWSLSKNAKDPKYEAGTTVLSKKLKKLYTKYNGKCRLYAVWRKTVKIRFVSNGATKSTFPSAYTKYKLNSTVKGKIRRTGCQFLGWSVTPDAVSATYSANPKINTAFIRGNGRSVTLYAVWEEVLPQTDTGIQAVSDKETTQPSETEKTDPQTSEPEGHTVNDSDVPEETVATEVYAINAVNTGCNADDAIRKNAFDIQCFLGPDAKTFAGASGDSVAQDMKNAGFAITSLHNQYSPSYDIWNTTYLEDGVNTLQRANIKTYIHNGVFRNVCTMSDTEIQNCLKNPINNVMNSIFSKNNVLGIDLVDEPDKNQLGNFVTFAKKLNNGAYGNAFRVKEFYLNLFPNVVNPLLLKSKQNIYNPAIAGSEIVYDKANLKDYMKNYVNLVTDKSASGFTMVSFDHYPTLTSYNDAKRDYYYTNMADVYTLASKNGKRAMNIVNLTYPSTDCENWRHISYQVYSALAFGMKRISYFTYQDPVAINDGTWQNSSNKGYLVDVNCNKTPVYSTVKTINQWAYQLGSLLYPCILTKAETSNGVVYVDNGGKSRYTDLIGENAVFSNNCVISQFRNPNTGKTMIMFTNASVDKEVRIKIQNPQKMLKLKCYCPAASQWVQADRNMEVFDASGNRMFNIDHDHHCLVIDGGCAVVIAEA